MPVLIMFRSLTYAQRGLRVLEQSGVGAAIAKAPHNTTDQGCTYCIRIPDRLLQSALLSLDKNGIRYGRILRLDTDEKYREVTL